MSQVGVTSDPALGCRRGRRDGAGGAPRILIAFYTVLFSSRLLTSQGLTPFFLCLFYLDFGFPCTVGPSPPPSVVSLPVVLVTCGSFGVHNFSYSLFQLSAVRHGPEASDLPDILSDGH